MHKSWQIRDKRKTNNFNENVRVVVVIVVVIIIVVVAGEEQQREVEE